jgi:hypothetical protein
MKIFVYMLLITLLGGCHGLPKRLRVLDAYSLSYRHRTEVNNSGVFIGELNQIVTEVVNLTKYESVPPAGSKYMPIVEFRVDLIVKSGSIPNKTRVTRVRYITSEEVYKEIRVGDEIILVFDSSGSFVEAQGHTPNYKRTIYLQEELRATENGFIHEKSIP